MPNFSKESLQRLREKVDIVEVLSSHISLKPSGSKMTALCPFHDEKTPSFVVGKGEQHYHCYGCGAHGDSIQFLMAFLRISFVEAVEMLAEKFHVPMEEKEKGEYQGPSKYLLKDVLETASRFYQCYLLHTSEGRKALSYLFSRGIDLSFIRRFGIGLSPVKEGCFLRYMKEKKISFDLLEKTGLVRTMYGKNKEFFLGRIMIPILDRAGSVIGFSARKYQEGGGPKYINTQETLLFKKSQVLFGLSYARKAIIQKKSALLVEGQIDALRLLHSGFLNAAASQGTAFTKEQAKILLSLGVERVFLAFDADEAGKNSAEKVGNLFQKEGVDVSIIRLEEGTDPDTILMDKGPNYWEDLVKNAQDYLPFVYEKKQAASSVTSPGIKTKILTEMADQIRTWETPLLVHESLKKLAEIGNVPDWTLGAAETPPNFSSQVEEKQKKKRIDPDRILETDFLRLLLLLGESKPELVTIAKSNLCANDLKTSASKELYALYLQHVKTKKSVDFLALSMDMSSREQEFLAEILQKRVDPLRAKEHLVLSIQKILERRWMEKREDIKNKIMHTRLDEEEALALAKQFDALKKEMPQVQV